MLATFISHTACATHLTPPNHPECPARLDVINNQLLMSGIDCLLLQVEAQAATDNDLLRVHSQEYLAQITAAIPESGIVKAGEDIYLSPRSLEAARFAAGAGITALKEIMAQHTDAVFCNVRPAGHHAERNRSTGFCIFNNAAITAAYAMEKFNLTRIAIVDFDAHHGNGTQDIFFNEQRVLFCSLFQYPFYPDTPIAPVPAHIINVPLDRTAKGPDFQQAFSEYCAPALYAFKPQLIIISAGFDGYIEDDMSSISLTEQDYTWITKQLRQLHDQSQSATDAEQRCHGLISLLEGGYDLPSLGRCVMAHIKALAKL